MPTAPDQLIQQSTRHAAHLERYKTSAVNEYDDLLRKMEKHIAAELTGDITEWTRKRLNKQLSAIREVIRDSSKIVGDVFSGQVADLGVYEADFEARSLKSVIEYDFDLPPENQLKAALITEPLQATGVYEGSLLGDMVDDWSKSTIKRVTGAVRLGYARGVPTQKLIRDMLAADGALAKSARELENFVRTGLAHSASVARESTWRQNKSVVKGVRITATIDRKTTVICRSLDGQVFPVNKGPRPPFHISCRTTTAATLDDRYKFLEADATRAARDPETGKAGSISAKETFYGWLKSEPRAVQDSIIGPTRGKLLRNGGISAKRFAELQLDKNYLPITLDEMRELDPVAFIKAGI